jgi:hypothetical protein
MLAMKQIRLILTLWAARCAAKQAASARKSAKSYLRQARRWEARERALRIFSGWQRKQDRMAMRQNQQKSALSWLPSSKTAGERSEIDLGAKLERAAK